MKAPGTLEVISRAVIARNDQFLTICNIVDGYHFLPGGHVIFGEKAEDAIRRNLYRQLGLKAHEVKMIGTIEHKYTRKNQSEHHEYNVVFRVTPVPESLDTLRCTDKGYECKWIHRAEIPAITLLPPSLKSAIEKWLHNEDFFWDSTL